MILFPSRDEICFFATGRESGRFFYAGRWEIFAGPGDAHLLNMLIIQRKQKWHGGCSPG